ncbi:hypothetical protein VPH35_030618 [Triticum aestivum]|uniref:probable E3 ubiquitin-protein ligase LUL2 n=2 Tax=Triticum TaxID=4564 RepID=UPI001D00A56E|nr:probable E3 ubiquitin-protein ligase LUL2 [Triticum aestivum]
MERHRVVAVSAGVNVKGHTLRLEREDDGGHLLAFSFDADVPRSITVYFFAQEGDDCVLKGTKENLLKLLRKVMVRSSGNQVELESSSGTRRKVYQVLLFS